MGKHVVSQVIAVQDRIAVQDKGLALRWAGAGFLALGLAALAGHARAEDQKIITSHGISTFGDLKYGPDFTPDYVNPDAPKGGEISESAFGTFDSVNPYSVKGDQAAGSTLPYESLMTGVADEIGSSYCLMCTTIEYPEDRSWVVFNLRDDVKFSDGSPMTAEDVAFTFNEFATKGLSDYRTILTTQIDKVEVLDPHKIKFTFKPGIPWRDLPAQMGSTPVFSKAYYEANKQNLEESSMKPFLGTGPYVLDKVVSGQTITYKRNPDYWGEKLNINKGQNNFDTIRFEYFGDPAAMFEGFKAGAYTFRQENSSKQWATGYDFPAVANGWVQKVELPNGNKANGQSFIFNLRRDQFKDPRVREAIGLMFNFEWSNQTLFYGLYTRINSFWENSYLAATGAPSDAEKALLQPLVDQGLEDASILTDDPIKAPVSGATQLDRGNLRKASKLLDDAGWAVGADGMRKNVKGETLKVEFLNADPAWDRIINPYVENLKALGVDAVLTDVDDAQLSERTDPPNFDFDMIVDNLTTGYELGDDMTQQYGSATANNSSYNRAGLASKPVDALIDVARNSKTREENDTAAKALDRVLLREKMWVPQWYKNVYTVAYYDQFEHPETLPPYALGELSFWWYDADKAAKLKAAGALK
jgi:microcin C transport system substrate-binding protein